MEPDPPALRHTGMTRTASPAHPRHGRAIPCSVVATIAAILAVSACSGSGGSSGSDARGLAPQIYNGVQGAPSRVAPAGGSAGSGSYDASGPVPSGSSSRSGAGLGNISLLSLDRAQIKKAQIALRSDKVAGVVSSIETIAASQGGFIDSEDTSTDTHGVAQSSAITLRVPVDSFDAAVSAVTQLGSLESKKTTTVDVTGQVADVASRVTSAKDSITQLRVLFSHATKLGDIITLESELSQREADLEALEAQQRVLTAQTSLSTIAVSVTRNQAPPPRPGSDDHSGFVGGLRQGWDALVTTFDNVAHALGAALPIGLTLVVLALLGWAAARRLPRRRAGTSG